MDKHGSYYANNVLKNAALAQKGRTVEKEYKTKAVAENANHEKIS